MVEAYCILGSESGGIIEQEHSKSQTVGTDSVGMMHVHSSLTVDAYGTCKTVEDLTD